MPTPFEGATNPWPATLQALREPVCFLNCSGQILQWNAAFEELRARCGNRLRFLESEAHPILDRQEQKLCGRWYRMLLDPVKAADESLTGHVLLLVDVTDRKRAEGVMQARLRLMEFAAGHSLNELLVATLDEAEQLTDSEIGFYHFLNPDQTTISLQAWSTRTSRDMCRAEGQGRHYDLALAGVWADCIRLRQAVIHNDYASAPNRRGLPPGHSTVLREVVVPVFRNNLIVALLGVGNKQTDYIDEDLETVSQLADLAWDIVERKRSAEAIEHSEHRFRAIVESSHAGYFRVDREGRFEGVNAAWLHMHGFDSASEVIGQPYTLTASLEDRHHTESTIQQLLAGVSVPDGESSHRCRDGSVGYHTLSAHPIREREAVVGFEGFVIDTTSLRQARADYAVLFERMLNGFALHEAITDATGQLVSWRFIAVNPAFEKITGMPASQVVGRRVEEVLPVHEPEWHAAFAEVVATGRPAYFEARSANSGRQMQVTAFRTVANRFAALFMDVTERRQADAQLRRQAALLDAANDAIHVRDLGGIVTFWNAGAARLHGVPRHEALGRTISDLLPFEAAALDAAHASVIHHGEWSGELRLAGGGGEDRHLFCRWSLLRDEHGEPREILSIHTDITEQKRLETQFLRAQRLEAIGTLASGIAHDLNNILAPIVMTAPLLREALTHPEDLAAIDTVETCAQRGADIVRQVLIFARGAQGARAVICIRHLLHDMAKLIRETFPRDIQPVLDVAVDTRDIDGDATQIHQALMNLCVNARDAMPEGGSLTIAAANVMVDTTLAASTPGAIAGPHVRITVADTGTGIAPENLERIFDPFFTTKPLGKGTGLGLPSVLGIVRGHGGFLKVASQPGSGSRFDLYLPASRHPTDASRGSAGRTGAPEGRAELVLVVDDEVALRHSLRRMLEANGYRVITAADGAEGLSAYQAHPDVSAVITDMMMPGMGGPALIAALKKIDPDILVLGMTGLPDRSNLKQLDEQTLAAMLTKPFTTHEVLGTLRRALDARRSRD